MTAARWTRVTLRLAFGCGMVLMLSLACVAPAGAVPVAGASCSSGAPRACGDETTALVCQDGIYEPYACAAGCTGQGVCNFTLGAAGDACFQTRPGDGRRAQPAGTDLRGLCRQETTHQPLPCEDEAAPCLDAAALLCDEGVLIDVPCRGPRGCLARAGQGVVFFCETGWVRAGEACERAAQGTGACSDDAGAMLLCDDGGYRHQAWCGGGCVLDRDAGQVLCHP